MEYAVFRLQTPDSVDVVGQAVVEVPELMFLLQSGDPGRTKRCAATARASLAGRSRSRGRHLYKRSLKNGIKDTKRTEPDQDTTCAGITICISAVNNRHFRKLPWKWMSFILHRMKGVWLANMAAHWNFDNVIDWPMGWLDAMRLSTSGLTCK